MIYAFLKLRYTINIDPDESDWAYEQFKECCDSNKAFFKLCVYIAYISNYKKGGD